MGGVFSGSDRESTVSANSARASADEAAASARLAEDWAVGPNGTDDVPTDENNAHYWAQQAMGAVNITGTAPISVDADNDVSLDDDGVTIAKLAVTDGSAGQILSTDGAGNLSFINQDAPPSVSLDSLTDVDITDEATNQFIRYDGTSWKNVTVDLNHGITAGDGLNIDSNNVISVTQGGISNALLGALAVTGPKIANATVSSGKLAPNAVIAGKIADDAVTAGTIADDVVVTGTILDANVTTAKIADDAVDGTKLNTTNSPTAGQVLSGNLDDTFTWVDQSGGGGTDNITASNGLVRTGNDIAIVTAGLTAAQLADGAVTAGKLANDSVTSASIQGSAVTNTKLATDAVTTVKIQDDAVTSSKIIDGAITSTKLGANSVLEASIMNNVVTNSKIIAQAINEDKLDVSNTGTPGQLLSSDGDGTFTWVTESGGTQYTADGSTLALSAGNVFSVADGGIDTAQIADDAVNAAKIADGAITRQALSITNTGLDGQVLSRAGNSFTWEPNTGSLQGLSDTSIPSDLNVRSFLEYSPADSSWMSTPISEVLRLDDLFDADITSPDDNQFLRYNGTSWVNEAVSIPATLSATAPVDISNNTVSLNNSGITSTFIAPDAVTEVKINDGAVTTDKLGTSAVTNAKIGSEAVTSSKLGTGAVTAGKIASNAVTESTIATHAVTSFKIAEGAIDSTRIADNAVTADELNVVDDGIAGQFLTSAGDGSFTWSTASGGTNYTADETTLELSASNVFSVKADGIDNAQIADNAIHEEQIQDGAVGTDQIANKAITEVLINDNAVTEAKIASSAVTNTKIQSGTIQADRLAANIPVSTWSDVDTSGVNNGQLLGFDGTNWVPVNGGGTPSDNSRLGVQLNPSSITEGTGTTPVTVTLSIVSAISGETITGQSVTVVDTQGHTVAVTGSGNSWSFTASNVLAGTYVVRASATLTANGVATVHNQVANLRVIASNTDWYQTISASAPTDVGTMTDNDNFNSPETATFQSGGNPTNARKAYLALPTHSGGYAFTLGVFPASDVTDLGVISTNYTLYRLNDADFDDRQSGTLIITITES